MIQSCMFFSKIGVIVCSVHFRLYFYSIGDNIAVDCLKDEIALSLRANSSLQFSQYVALNHVREKGKT